MLSHDCARLGFIKVKTTENFSIIMKKHIVSIFLFAACLSVSAACKTHQKMPVWTKLALGKIGVDYGDSVRKYLIGKCYCSK